MLSMNADVNNRGPSYSNFEQSSSNPKTIIHPSPQSNQIEGYMQFGLPTQPAGHKRPISDAITTEANEAAAVRRRISRACDQCNQMRSKCDGRLPCGKCIEGQLECKYERAHKKRGRVPKREQSQIDVNNLVPPQTVNRGSPQPDELGHKETLVATGDTPLDGMLGASSAQHGTNYTSRRQAEFYHEYGSMRDAGMDTANSGIAMGADLVQPNAVNYSVENSAAFDLAGYGFPLGDDYSVAFMGRAPMVESPDWSVFTSPRFIAEQRITNSRPLDTLRFPVLLTILPHLEGVVSQNQACDLLEQYFATTTPSSYQLKNPYVLSHVFRKQSILHPTNPRPCNAALLASMLWISAQHSDAAFLTTQPDARARICQKLLELTTTMLKPLVHSSEFISTNLNGNQNLVRTDTSLGGLVLPVDIITGNEISRNQVDNIVTYIHLATVVSASERKAASLRWWHAAWSLGREIRLGRELPSEASVEGGLKAPTCTNETSQTQQGHPRAASFTSNSTHNEIKAARCSVSEEDREERRRTWWLLYMMDRHLALCYNQPLFFLNKECEGLLQPLEDAQFQLGLFDNGPLEQRRRGLDIKCRSLSVYGFFLPLMVILGEILDLNHTRNRPRFGAGAKRPRDFSDTVDEIAQQLDAFEKSLYDIGNQHQSAMSANTGSVLSGSKVERYGNREQELQNKVVTAYGTHIMHVLHILLTGKWDPIAMLDDNDLWISSQSFVTATGHAVSASEALADIIEYDPDLSLMPYFFGIHLLQGSFLMLLFADKLQDDITPEVVKACETIVRAHEACVSTLDNQYQRNFRRVMRSALQQFRGRVHDNATEQQNWRREILKLYRWTGDGTGLAL